MLFSYSRGHRSLLLQAGTSVWKSFSHIWLCFRRTKSLRSDRSLVDCFLVCGLLQFSALVCLTRSIRWTSIWRVYASIELGLLTRSGCCNCLFLTVVLALLRFSFFRLPFSQSVNSPLYIKFILYARWGLMVFVVKVHLCGVVPFKVLSCWFSLTAWTVNLTINLNFFLRCAVRR